VTDSPAPSRSERQALADLLAELGPDAPTCCAGWRTRDLAAHLVVRDRRPDAAAGFVVGGPLAAWTDRVMAGARRRDFAALVADVRSGPPAWVPTAWPAVDRLVNTAEMAIHHEDVRRAQPGWSPRELDRATQDRLWSAVPLLGRSGAAGTDGGLIARRTDLPGGTSVRRLRAGSPMTTVAGPPLEVLLWVSGRQDVARVEVTGG
jgi:uncharacterized protein (TIGR03085 family)